jgi:hypothetical protein
MRMLQHESAAKMQHMSKMFKIGNTDAGYLRKISYPLKTS